MKILIIGAGSIGTRHLKNLIALGCKDLVVSDPDASKPKSLAKIGNFVFYRDAKEAIQKSKPRVVLICAPAHLHIPLARLAISYGADVFIEKPLSVNLSGIDSLIKKAKEDRRVVMVACNFLFHEGFRKLQYILEKKIYGKPLLCRVAQGFYLPEAKKNINLKKIYMSKKKEGGGVILDFISHPIYYLSALFGDVKRVASLVSRLHPLGFNSDELAIVALEHANGVLSNISSDYACRKLTHRVEVVTEKGLLTLDIQGDSLFFEDGQSKRELYRGDKDLNKMFIEEMEHFLRCVERRNNPLQDLSGGKKILQILLNATNKTP